MKAEIVSYTIKCEGCKLNYMKAADHITKIEKPTECPRCGAKFPTEKVRGLQMQTQLCDVDEMPKAKGHIDNTVKEVTRG